MLMADGICHMGPRNHATNLYPKNNSSRRLHSMHINNIESKLCNLFNRMVLNHCYITRIQINPLR